MKCDGTRAETRFCLSAKRTSPFKSAGASVQSTTGSRGARISCSNAGYTMFRGSVKSTGYPLHSSVFPSLPLLCVTVCRHISTGLYMLLVEIQQGIMSLVFSHISSIPFVPLSRFLLYRLKVSQVTSYSLAGRVLKRDLSLTISLCETT